MMMNPIREKNIITCIILTIVTCGIYGVIWFIAITDDMKNASGDISMPSGGMAFLLTIVTCGIYGYFWIWKMAKASIMAKAKRGMPAEDNTILYLVLQLFGLGVVNYCLIQNDLNTMATMMPNQQNMNYNPNMNYNQNMNYNPNGNYNQNMNYNPNGNYNQNMNYNQNNGFNQNNNYDPNNNYNQNNNQNM